MFIDLGPHLTYNLVSGPAFNILANYTTEWALEYIVFVAIPTKLLFFFFIFQASFGGTTNKMSAEVSTAGLSIPISFTRRVPAMYLKESNNLLCVPLLL